MRNGLIFILSLFPMSGLLILWVKCFYQNFEKMPKKLDSLGSNGHQLDFLPILTNVRSNYCPDPPLTLLPVDYPNAVKLERRSFVPKLIIIMTFIRTQLGTDFIQ